MQRLTRHKPILDKGKIRLEEMLVGESHAANDGAQGVHVKGRSLS